MIHLIQDDDTLFLEGISIKLLYKQEQRQQKIHRHVVYSFISLNECLLNSHKPTPSPSIMDFDFKHRKIG